MAGQNFGSKKNDYFYLDKILKIFPAFSYVKYFPESRGYKFIKVKELRKKVLESRVKYVPQRNACSFCIYSINFTYVFFK